MIFVTVVSTEAGIANEKGLRAELEGDRGKRKGKREEEEGREREEIE
jgi:hypothetical protein